jgi:hypothetical protein
MDPGNYNLAIFAPALNSRTLEQAWFMIVSKKASFSSFIKVSSAP